MTATPVRGSGGVCDGTATGNGQYGSGGVFDGTATGNDSAGAGDGSVTAASGHKGTSYSPKRPRDEATRSPRVSCVVECSVLLANRHLIFLHKLDLCE